MEEGERGGVNEDSVKRDLPHPWPHLSESFDVELVPAQKLQVCGVQEFFV